MLYGYIAKYSFTAIPKTKWSVFRTNIKQYSAFDGSSHCRLYYEIVKIKSYPLEITIARNSRNFAYKARSIRRNSKMK
jgi:hypothetical protein